MNEGLSQRRPNLGYPPGRSPAATRNPLLQSSEAFNELKFRLHQRLITVCVEAGLGLDTALARVAEKTEGPFGEELTICLKEISLGKLRRDALIEMGERIGVPDLISFINAVMQAESMGTSIATVLRIQAEQMRMRRRQRAEQQAQAAPIKMMFPLVFCIFPTLFIVILGPAALSIYEQVVKQ